MLFVDDAARGRGIGSALLKHAVDRWGVHRLDVNEQNPAARGFYEHERFRVASRSELGEAGRPFPLLHMERCSGSRMRSRFVRCERPSGQPDRHGAYDQA